MQAGQRNCSEPNCTMLKIFRNVGLRCIPFVTPGKSTVVFRVIQQNYSPFILWWRSVGMFSRCSSHSERGGIEDSYEMSSNWYLPLPPWVVKFALLPPEKEDMGIMEVPNVYKKRWKTVASIVRKIESAQEYPKSVLKVSVAVRVLRVKVEPVPYFTACPLLWYFSFDFIIFFNRIYWIVLSPHSLPFCCPFYVWF